MKTITLTQGKETIVDDQDYEACLVYTWCFDGKYAQTRIKGSNKALRMHRFIAERMGWDLNLGFILDHINGNKLDNRRSNLRLVTNSQNALNAPSAKGYTRIPSTGRFRAQLKVDGIHVLNKVFATRQEAQDAYNKAKEIYLK